MSERPKRAWAFFYGLEMSVKHVITHFETLGKVPVDLRDVLAQVRLLKPDERITVKAIDDNYQELRASILRTKIEDGTTFMVPIYESVVVYSSRMPEGWQQLGCCKELMHILEPEPLWTSSLGDVLALAEKMATGTEHDPKSSDGLQALADEIGKWQAVTVLFPYALYERLLPLFQQRRITAAQIAEEVMLPEDIVEVVMTPLWAWMRETFKRWS